MSEFIGTLEGTTSSLPLVVLRLLAALVLGVVVAQVYRRARSEPASSFTTTLVLMTVLIAMVTQVIGDNIARAFSLVGALSIVRFRTVVRDTQDTAYVIFAVAVGMAVGASSLWIAVTGVAVVAVAAFLLRASPAAGDALPFTLQVRLGLGQDPRAVLGQTFDEFLVAHRLIEVTTARQGAATEITYRISLQKDETAHTLVTRLNRLEGVQAVALERVDEEGREQ